MIEDVTDLGGFEFRLNYNSTVVTVESVILGDFLTSTGREPLNFSDIDNGKLTFGAFSSGEAAGPSGEGILAVITYTFSDAQTDVTLELDDIRTKVTGAEVIKALPRELESGMITPTCDVTAITPNNGIITPVNSDIRESGAVIVKEGGEQVFTIVPENDCYEISDVIINGDSKGLLDTYTFENITCNNGESYSIAADFTRKQFTVTSDVSGDGGSITPAEPQTVDCGSDITFTISPETTTPDQCYHIADVLADGVSVGAVSSHIFGNVTADHSITASFAINNCNITPTAGPNGSISPSDPVRLICESQKFDMTPDYGYSVEDVVVNGVSQGPLSSYTFDTCGAGGQTIHATFIPDYFTINVCQNDNGRIHLALPSRPSGEVRVTRGSEPVFEIVSDACRPYGPTNMSALRPLTGLVFYGYKYGELSETTYLRVNIVSSTLMI